MVRAAILGMVHGLTEFLPVSSTGHLVLMRWLVGWGGELDSMRFDIALHTGTLISLLVCFWRDILEILRDNRRLLIFILAGTAPVGITGLLGSDLIENYTRSPYIIVVTLTAFAFVMLIAERFQKTKEIGDIGLTDALIIGLAQAVALIPGVSRSGITISAALMLGLKREASARFSFLLAIPAIGGATLLEAKGLMSGPKNYEAGMPLAGLIASVIASTVAIKFLLRYLRNHPLNVFAYYRFALAVFIVGWLWLKV